MGALAAGASCPQPLEFGFGRGRKEAPAEHSSTSALRTGNSGGFPSAGEPAGIDSLPAGLCVPLSCSEGDPELSSAGAGTGGTRSWISHLKAPRYVRVKLLPLRQFGDSVNLRF